MNKFKTLALVLFSSTALLVTSCSKDNETPEPQKPVILTVNTVSDLDGSAGAVYYSLSTNKQITGDDITAGKWDIKFSGTSIFVNGGTSGSGTTQAQTVDGKFEEVNQAPADGYKTDASGVNAIAKWYQYTGEDIKPNHTILPLPGKIIIIKTTAGKYAKMEIKSYYKGNPAITEAFDANTPSKFYTFRFAYQADGSTSLQ
ncbi:MAG: HmuY family protein [Bacteroidota bacterium]